MDPNTIRVLSLDGGGVRGYLTLRWLQKFIELWGIAEGDLHKYFDVICGTSIGGIQALAYAYGKTPTELSEFFTRDAKWVFTVRTTSDLIRASKQASEPSNLPSGAQQGLMLASGNPLYKAISSKSNYGHAKLTSLADDMFGLDTLQDLRTNVIVPAFNESKKTPVLFSNYDNSQFVGKDTKIRDVGLATSAAPTYLPIHEIDGEKYYDGGIMVNNPAQLGLSIGKMLKPTSKRYCVLSLGTGLNGFAYEDVGARPSTGFSPKYLPTADILTKVVIPAGTTGVQETMAKAMYLDANFSCNNFHFYRFQTALAEDRGGAALDNSTDEYLAYLQEVAYERFEAEKEEIIKFIGHLSI